MSTPKATKDRIHRAGKRGGEELNPLSKKKEHNGKRRKSVLPDLVDRAASKRKSRGASKSKPKGNKKRKFDSTRGGNRAPISECIQFLGKHINSDIEKFGVAVEDFKYRKTLKNIIDHIIAVSEDGWKLNDGKFIHESGRVAFSDNWMLIGGRICPKGKGPVNLKSGWILEARAKL
jgi:hypothetical protein